MSNVISNSYFSSAEVVACAHEAARQSNGCNDPDNQTKVLGRHGLFLPKVTVLLNRAYSYDITCSGEHGERYWTECFKKASSNSKEDSSSQDLLKQYECVHEERLALLVDAGTEEDNTRLDRVESLPGRYTVYTLVIRHDYLLMPSQVYHVGTICVYSPPERDGEKRISLDISPLHESCMSRDTSLANICSMRDCCVKQLHEFAEQQNVCKDHCVLSHVNFDYMKN